jgi:hypothetical protein
VVAATAAGFATSGLELGGKDPAYVRADANLAHAIETLTDGAFFNAGQSCCGIKRIYVAAPRYDEFVAGVVAHAQVSAGLAARSGNDARTRGAHRRRRRVRAQVREAVARGARQLIDEKAFAASSRDAVSRAAGAGRRRPLDGDHARGDLRAGGRHHEGRSDEEAVRLMNDSEFGLTAAIYSAMRARRGARRCARDRHGVPESLRLSRSGARLDRRQEFGARLHLVARRLRAADAAEVLSLQGNDMSSDLRGNWNYPTTIWAGPGRIAELPAACARAGIRGRCWSPTRAGRAPMIKSALAALERCGAVRRGARQSGQQPRRGGPARLPRGGHDGVVAFGGGSALDAGKVVAFMSGQTRPLWDFEDIGDWWTRADPAGIAPVVAVPTTAGTGSEVGRAGVILNEETHQKKIIFHPQMMPRIVILDAELTVGLPRA